MPIIWAINHFPAVSISFMDFSALISSWSNLVSILKWHITLLCFYCNTYEKQNWAKCKLVCMNLIWYGFHVSDTNLDFNLEDNFCLAFFWMCSGNWRWHNISQQSCPIRFFSSCLCFPSILRFFRYVAVPGPLARFAIWWHITSLDVVARLCYNPRFHPGKKILT